jgi:dephospho-CoA kinase
MVRAEAHRFLKRQRARRSLLVVLDIPLLFETGGEVLCDAIMVVTAPLFLQKARAFGRPGMTEQKLEAIRARQMSEVQKRRRADFVVQTGLGKGYTFRRIKKIVTALRQCP